MGNSCNSCRENENIEAVVDTGPLKTPKMKGGGFGDEQRHEQLAPEHFDFEELDIVKDEVEGKLTFINKKEPETNHKPVNKDSEHIPKGDNIEFLDSMPTLSKEAIKSKSRFYSELKISDSKNEIFGPVFYKKEKVTYTGGYYKGMRYGYGEEIGNDGSGYFGNWKEDKKQGQGMMCLTNGNLYLGNFTKGEANGKGMLYVNLTNSKIEGEFKNGVPKGECIETYQDGSYYSGNFVDGQKTGEAQFYFVDGSKYSGQFVNGKANGEGTYIYSNGVSIYKGQFKDNLQEGYGELKTNKGITYKGEFKAGKKNGKGELSWEDGKKIIGQFVNGNYEGECKFVSAGGKVKWAECKDGKKVRWIDKKE